MEQWLGSSSNDLLPAPVEGGRSLTTQERNDVDLSSTINGWGSDLDPAVRQSALEQAASRGKRGERVIKVNNLQPR